MEESRSVSAKAVNGFYNRVVKRGLDLLLSLLGLVLLSPILLISALAVKCSSPLHITAPR